MEVKFLNESQGILLSLDCKRSRIRMHKAILPLIDNPKYIQLLLRPDTKEMALRGVDSALPNCETVRIKDCKDSASYAHEIYSSSFITALQAIADIPDPSITYHLPGRVFPSKRTAVFSLREITALSNKENV